MTRRRGWTALVVVGAVLLAFAVWWSYHTVTTTKITAYFDRTVGIYEGSEVRVLGVEVGKVDSVEPEGDQVKVVMQVDRSVDIPANAKAVQINPSIVSDRYIQLTPAYDGGPTMARTATIPRDRTATPVEVDQLYRSISELSDALGPNGANKNGAVSDVVRTSAANLAGNGEALNTAITNLSKTARALSDSRGDVFDTVKNLQKFVQMLAANDGQVRQFNTQLGSLAGMLGQERQNLGAALHQLSIALGDIAGFIDKNREQIQTNAESLTTLTKVISDQRAALAAALPVLPLALSNLYNIHDAESGTLAMRANLPDLQDPLGAQCRLLDLAKLKPGDPHFEDLGKPLRPIVDQCLALGTAVASHTPHGLVLPFGLLTAENIQRNPVPGTQPGIYSHRPAPSQSGGSR